jgi:cell fate regulator YaaT (PSP1 superfamily)
MSCGTCSSGGGCGTVGGCKSNGGCRTGGCNRLNTFDWLSGVDMLPVAEKFPYIEIRFKGGRKEFFKNNHKIELYTGDAVIVETTSGTDFGFISLQGELVRLQMKKKSVNIADEFPSILRKASKEDADKYEQIKAKELPTLYRTRQIINDLKLQMKLSDIEFQFDNKKATFFYSAEDRVDFRELIKLLANEFKVRVEMKQISLRQEAGRLGGIGICGRELCCSTWLTDFKAVNTSAARYQNLSINPQKLSGQCGRLKCCLNYELDTYMEALKDIPTVETNIQTTQGDARLQKTDIFKKMMWFSFAGNEGEWVSVKTDMVFALIELNKNGIKPNSLDPNDLADKADAKIPVRLNNDIRKLDDKFKNKKRFNNGGIGNDKGRR